MTAIFVTDAKLRKTPRCSTAGYSRANYLKKTFQIDSDVPCKSRETTLPQRHRLPIWVIRTPTPEMPALIMDLLVSSSQSHQPFSLLTYSHPRILRPGSQISWLLGSLAPSLSQMLGRQDLCSLFVACGASAPRNTQEPRHTRILAHHHPIRVLRAARIACPPMLAFLINYIRRLEISA